MPYEWTRLRSSPPIERKREVERICTDEGGRLCERETFYESSDEHCFALIWGPDDATLERILDRLGTPRQWTGLVSAEEKARGRRPPPSGNRPG